MTLDDALTVCSDVVAYVNGKFGKGKGAIYADSFGCHGNENSLTSCSYDTNTFECSHSQDAGITCSSTGQSSGTSSHSALYHNPHVYL